jgi:hypothetical protein
MENIELATVETNRPGVRAFIQPPDDFVLERASDEDLIRYGFSPRPRNPRALALWQKFLPEKINRVVPEFGISNISRRLPKFKHSSRGNPTSDNWNAVQIYDQTNHPFDKNRAMVCAKWHVPKVQCVPGAPQMTYNSSQWVGIGGTNGNANLLQAGIEADINCPRGNTLYQFWYEWLPGDQTEIPLYYPVVSPGDYVAVTVMPALTNQTDAFISVTNITQNYKGVSFTIPPPTGTQILGDSAEWVVERPEINGQLASLANYGGIEMQECFALGGTAGDLYVPDSAPTGTLSDVTMVDAAGQSLSSLNVVSHGLPSSPGANVPDIHIVFTWLQSARESL